MTACNKVSVYTTAEKPQTAPIPNQIVQSPPLSPPGRPPSTQERIAEIEKELAAPLTGKPGDAHNCVQNAMLARQIDGELNSSLRRAIQPARSCPQSSNGNHYSS